MDDPFTGIDAAIFALDGVVADTAGPARAGWGRVLGDHLADRDDTDPSKTGQPLDAAEYQRYLSGRSGIDGVLALLRAHGLALPAGTSDDPPGSATAWGLVRRIDAELLDLLTAGEVRVFDTTLTFIGRLRSQGIKTAVVSASRNGRHVLGAAGLSGLFDVRIDGADAQALGLPDFPDPSLLLTAARRLGVPPSRTAVLEGSPVGVEAGRRGEFGLVIGVDRVGQRAALLHRGADRVVGDLGDVQLPATGPSRGHSCLLCETAPGSSEWILDLVDEQPQQVGVRETLMTLGNGYLGVRGARPEVTADGVHYPGTYVAGVYDRLVSVVGGRQRADESLVNLPNWLPLSFHAQDAPWLGHGPYRVEHDHHVLDVRRGLLRREALVVDPVGRRTWLRQRRLVSMAAPHLAALETVLIPENWAGLLTLRSVIDGAVRNTNVADFAGLADEHLVVVDSGGDPQAPSAWLTVETVQSRVRVAEAVRTTVQGAAVVPGARHLVDEAGVVGDEVVVHVTAGQTVTVDKVVAVFTSRDRATDEPGQTARREVALAGDFGTLLADHDRAWARLWRHFRLGMDDGEQDQLASNVHMFHVLQTLSAHTADLDVGVPARGLHGEGYRGHVFWDELFVFPLLNYRMPQLTRALLLYRYRRLPESRRLAAASGLRGAQFAWQSASNGSEQTPAWLFNPRSRQWIADNSHRQYHVNLAIAYNVWQYWQVSGDAGFMAAYGTELLVEIARFWSSIAVRDPHDDRYDIRGVMGPDEFHDGYPGRPGEGIDNNAYVNVMTSWALIRALDAFGVLGGDQGSEVRERLGVSDAELAVWDRISRRLRVPFLSNGLIGQFEGYDELAELDWDGYRRRYHDIGRLDLILQAEGDTPNRYKASKQADVLMLFYLLTAEELTAQLACLGYPFDPAAIPSTVNYYLARTSHGSTLSRVAHAWVLSRVDRDRSWSLLRDALTTDLAEIRGGTTSEGIHLGAMAGTADILQRCYSGVEARAEVLWFNPRLPAELRGLDFDVLYRGQWLTVHIDHRTLTLHARPRAAAPIQVGFAGRVYELAPGRTLQLPLRPTA